MRILVVGDWHSELHERAVFDALATLGHQVERFAWHRYISDSGARALRIASTIDGADQAPATGAIDPARTRRSALAHLLRKAQNRFLAGPLIATINRDLEACARVFRPDLVFVYRGTHVLPSTLESLRRLVPRPILLGYNNDDPFAPAQPRSLWRHFIAGIPRYDAVLAYRLHNLGEYTAAGARRVSLLRSWYMPGRNHPVVLSPADTRRYACDVVFVGHYEDDGRADMLEGLVRAGIRMKLFGPGYEWNAVLARSQVLRTQVPVELVWGEDYNKALCGARIALCFLSKLNRDTYTRRCFEIPASGTLMLSEYSDDLASLYTPGLEADYFRDRHELLAQVSRYLGDEDLRRRVAAAGAQRVKADGHDVRSRMRALLAWVDTWKHEVRS